MKNIVIVVAAFFLATLFACQEKPVETSLPDTLKSNVEPYYFSAILDGPYDVVEGKVKAALKEEGFGVITTINMEEKLNEKLGVEFHKYVILGACSPNHAYKALQAEDKIGTMLPCNVIIQDIGNGQFEVAAVNPIASMMAIQNEALAEVAMEVTDKLKRAVGSLK